MLRYRTFQNADPPALVEIWRSRVGQEGLARPVSVDLFEQFVFAKLYFDYAGLILALDEDRPVGFVHAGFGPNSSGDQIATNPGVTCLIVVRPDCREAEVAASLLRQSEDYLQRHGAQTLWGGSARPLAPFYFGLYGGSEPAGILKSDTVSLRLFRSHGYEEVDQRCLFHCQLSAFRSPVDRRQIQWRRKMLIEERADPLAQSWWEACTTGDFDRTRFELVPRGGGPTVAAATFRGMESQPGQTVGRNEGLIDLEVQPNWQGQGLGTFLLSEAFRRLARQGVVGIHAQTSASNEGTMALFHKMGLEQVDEGIVFRKQIGPT